MRGSISLLFILSVLLPIVTEGSFALAQSPILPPVLRGAAAALKLQQDGRYDLGDRALRCQPDQKIGIWVESSSITVANAIIQDCDVGIVIMAKASAPDTDSSKRQAAAHVTHAKVEGTIVGILLAGSGGTASNNTVSGARYGIVVTGDDYVLIGNQSNQNSADGFLITGDRNLLEGNEASRNRGAGIRVATMVPMIQNRRFLSFIQDRGSGNIIRGNTALNNKIDLMEFAECGPAPFPPLANEWSDNVFNTRDPACIE